MQHRWVAGGLCWVCYTLCRAHSTRVKRGLSQRLCLQLLSSTAHAAVGFLAAVPAACAVDDSGRCCCLALPLQVMLLNAVKVPRNGPQLSLLVRDACEPGPAADILTVIGWTLPQHLTALSIGPLAAPCPNDVLVTLATLVNLQHLELQVGCLLLLAGLDGQ